MKNSIYLFSALFLSSFTVNADNTNNLNILENNASTSYRGYGNSFIFTEQGVEFSIYADGQFDFHMLNYGPSVNASVGNSNVNISFNSGFDYGAYVQYDEFGAIIQIENTPIFYDYYGRISQAGNIRINYNNRGFITRVGGLFVHYNRFNAFDRCTGFINVYNRAYVYRSWHRFYILPPVNYCVIYNQPYRKYYTPIRYRYDRPYTNNYRRSTAVASRRGNTVTRNRSYASRTDGRTRLASTPRTRTRNNTIASTTRTRGNTTSTPRTRSNTTTATLRTRSNIKSSSPKRTRTTSASQTRTRTNKTKKRSTPRTQKRVVSTNRNTKSKASKSSSKTKRTSTRNRSSR